MDSFLLPPTMSPPTINVPRRYDLADRMYEMLSEQIRDFQEGLAPDEEVGACLASFGQQVTVTIRDLGYYNPNLMIFHGIDSSGHEVTLLQHISQVCLLLKPIKVEGTARRVGFKPLSTEGKREDP